MNPLTGNGPPAVHCVSESNMKTKMLLLLAVSLLVFVDGCAKSEGRLMGVWISDTTETEWGPARLQLQFGTNGLLGVSMLAPTEDPKVLPGAAAEGKYSVQGKRIISDAINKGKPVQFQFEGEVLVIYGGSEPAMRLKRQ